MTDKPETDKADRADKPEPVANITNNEKVEVNEAVNKKLTEMSKEAKTRKKRKLQKPGTSKDTSTTVSMLTNNQIYMLLAVVGVIIAGASLYYQRKSVVKDEKPKVEQAPIKEHDHGPMPVVADLTDRSPTQSPGMYSF